MDEIFLGKTPVDGVIHVVSSGFASVRIPDSVKVLVKDHNVTTIKKFRQYQKKREIEDLEETCRVIRDAHRKYHSPKWMIIAVDKIDLHHNELAEISRQYSPSSKGEFVKQLKTSSDQVGSDFFRREAMPVMGCIEDFEWNGQVHGTQLHEGDRERYLAQFLSELESYCT